MWKRLTLACKVFRENEWNLFFILFRASHACIYFCKLKYHNAPKWDLKRKEKKKWKKLLPDLFSNQTSSTKIPTELKVNCISICKMKFKVPVYAFYTLWVTQTSEFWMSSTLTSDHKARGPFDNRGWLYFKSPPIVSKKLSPISPWHLIYFRGN